MRTSCLVLLAGCLCLGSVVADETPLEEPDKSLQAWFVLSPSFDTLDCTNEGYISAAEVDEHLMTLRHEYDLAMTFHRNTRKPNAEEQEQLLALNEFINEAMDENGDGIVSAFEYRSYVMDLISVLDGDGSGDVSPEELSAGAP